MDAMKRRMTWACSMVMGTVLGSAAAAEPNTSARDARSMPSRSVSIAGIDQDSAAGRALLHERIAHAARQVCAEHGRTLVVGRQQYMGDCVAAAIANAMAQLPAQRVAHTPVRERTQ